MFNTSAFVECAPVPVFIPVGFNPTKSNKSSRSCTVLLGLNSLPFILSKVLTASNSYSCRTASSISSCINALLFSNLSESKGTPAS